MKYSLSHGLFITFEGGEGAGKTTLIESIVRILNERGLHVLKTREPGGTYIGEEIRRILLDNSSPHRVSPYAELALFLASRSQHIGEVIGPALSAKKVVLCDRFNDSSIAYQGVARGLGPDRVADICQFFSEGLEPNLTLYLDIDPKVGLLRAKRERPSDRIEAEDIRFHQQIREAYHAIQKKHPKRFRLLDASQPPGHVLEEAMKWIDGLLSKAYV